MTKILLADDHVMLRKGLTLLITTLIAHAVVDEAGNGDEAFEKVKQFDYSMIILDVNMPDTDSFGLVSNILSVKPNANILMFSMNPEEVYAKKYFQLGVRGYLNKTAPEAEIKIALENVLKGKRYISAALSMILTDMAIGNKSANPFENLSPREFEIVLHLLQGKSLSHICQALNLQPSTVSTHKARIFVKLNCNNIIDVNSLAKVFNVIPAV